jgi:hypothetical protein
MHLNEMKCLDVDWIRVDGDKDKWQVLLNMVMNFFFSEKYR